jgi:hypothetical protein
MNRARETWVPEAFGDRPRFEPSADGERRRPLQLAYNGELYTFKVLRAAQESDLVGMIGRPGRWLPVMTPLEHEALRPVMAACCLFLDGLSSTRCCLSCVG